jgi:hypothetical protein
VIGLTAEGYAVLLFQRCRDATRALGRLVLVVAFGLAFLLTVAAALAGLLRGDDAARASLKDVLAALLPTETLLLGAAVVWYFAGR